MNSEKWEAALSFRDLTVATHESDECVVSGDTMTENSHILFGKSLDQLRLLGAWGGRTYGRNQRARRAQVQALPQVARRRTPPRETAAEAIRSLDAQFPWLAGAERATVAERQFRKVIGHRPIPLLSSMANSISKKPVAKGAAVA
jgi:hypothetical protein